MLNRQLQIPKGIVLAIAIGLTLWLLFFALLDKACAQIIDSIYFFEDTNFDTGAVHWPQANTLFQKRPTLNIQANNKSSDNWQTHKNPFLAWNDIDELIDIKYHVSFKERKDGFGFEFRIDSTRVIFRSLSPHELGVAAIWQITIVGEPKLIGKQRYQEAGWIDIKK